MSEINRALIGKFVKVKVNEKNIHYVPREFVGLVMGVDGDKYRVYDTDLRCEYLVNPSEIVGEVVRTWVLKEEVKPL